MSKFDAKFESGELILGLDTDEDGTKLLDVKVSLNEAIQEVLQRGEKIEGAKLVSFEFGLGGLKLALDTDQDGEKLLHLEINLAEALDELGLFKSE